MTADSSSYTVLIHETACRSFPESLTPIVALLIIGGTTTYAASPNTLPTSPLYPLKQAWEAFTVAMAATPDAKVRTLITQAASKLTEAQTLSHEASASASAKAALAPSIAAAQQDLNDALVNAKQVQDPSKRKELEDQIAKAAGDSTTEIEHEVENETDSSDKTSIEDAKTKLEKVSTDAKGSD